MQSTGVASHLPRPSSKEHFLKPTNPSPSSSQILKVLCYSLAVSLNRYHQNKYVAKINKTVDSSNREEMRQKQKMTSILSYNAKVGNIIREQDKPKSYKKKRQGSRQGYSVGEKGQKGKKMIEKSVQRELVENGNYDKFYSIPNTDHSSPPQKTHTGHPTIVIPSLPFPSPQQSPLQPDEAILPDLYFPLSVLEHRRAQLLTRRVQQWQCIERKDTKSRQLRALLQGISL